MRCLAQATRLAATEAQASSRQLLKRSHRLIGQAAELVARARGHPSICPVCDRPLADGGGLLFQGEVLVHAVCWRDKPTSLDDRR